MVKRRLAVASVLLFFSGGAEGFTAPAGPATPLHQIPRQARTARMPPLHAPLAPHQRSSVVVSALDPNMYIPEGVHLRSYLGFLGGTIGVVGTLLTYEKARFKMKQRILCPYCTGGGVLTCGECVGTGTLLASPAADGHAANGPCQCQTCGGLGVVACVNCKGEGVTVPIALQRKEIDMPMDEFEAALEEMGIAALAANYVNAQARDRLNNQLAKVSGQLDNGTRQDPTSAAKPKPLPSSDAEAAADGSAEVATAEAATAEAATAAATAEATAAASAEATAAASAEATDDASAEAADDASAEAATAEAATAEAVAKSNAASASADAAAVVASAASAAAAASSSSAKYKSLTGLNIRARLAARMKPKGDSPFE